MDGIQLVDFYFSFPEVIGSLDIMRIFLVALLLLVHALGTFHVRACWIKCACVCVCALLNNWMIMFVFLCVHA